MLDDIVDKPKTSRYQIVASMTVGEALSEGYASYDDFYDPDEEKEKEAIAEEIRKARETPWEGDEVEF